MIITFVMDQYYNENNGTSISAKRFAENLRMRGHEVRVVCIDEGHNEKYGLKERNFGFLINKIIHSQGMRLAKPDKNIMKEAFMGSDIVHISMPFKLGRVAIKVCKQLNIPATAAFHVQPENITSTLYMKNFKPINTYLYSAFYHEFYKHFKHVHCPSLMIANQLKNHGYKTNLHVISNGYDPSFQKLDIQKDDKFIDKFCIAFIGRMSREKRHDVLIEAVALSKYKDRIQLIFGGKGPTQKRIKHLARKKLSIQPIFSFFSKDELIRTLNMCELYIHPADIEIEAISCIEAIACGVVPIINSSPRSATPQFAINDNCTYKMNDAKDLANKIDYWVEHETERREFSKKYAEHAKKYAIEYSILECEEMFNQAALDWNKNFNAKKAKHETNIIKRDIFSDHYRKKIPKPTIVDLKNKLNEIIQKTTTNIIKSATKGKEMKKPK